MKRTEGARLTGEFFRGNHLSFLTGMAGVVLMVGVNIALSWLMQQLIDVSSGSEGAFSLGQLALLSLGLMGILLLSCGMKAYAEPRFLQRAMEQYKDAAFRELMKKGIGAFSGESTSTYISALSNDANSIETNYLSQIFSLVTYAGLFLGAFVMMLCYSPLLTLAAFLLTFLPMAASLLAGKPLSAAEEQVSRRNESFLGVLKDSLSGFSVIKSFKAEAAMLGQFSAVNREAAAAKRKRMRLNILLQSLGAVMGAVAQIGIFLIGAALALTGRGITAGVVIVFVQLMNFVVEPVRAVPSILANRKAALGLVKKLTDALSANVRETGETVPGRLEAGIELRRVCFGYDADKEVLHAVSCSFEAGKSYIVGGSGSGKSTLLNLLMAANGSYTGEICYNGRELSGIRSESLYDIVSIIQQNVFVFNSSIRDNVTMFSAFPDEEVERAMALSGLTELVRERGGDFLCGENGSGLSGGEKQRLSIARSLLRRTPVLLVDEATAALDAETAFMVSDSILKLEGLTRIVVTHSLEEALLRRYDGILTLKNGTLWEQGTFDWLMEEKGYFYSLFTVAQ